MTNKSDFESAFNAGAASKVVLFDVEGVPHVQVPSDASLKSLAHLLPAPQRIQASPEFHSVDGFLAYTDEFAAKGTRVFVDKETWRFFTVFDSHAPGAPAWGDHCASMALKKSAEWSRLRSVDGVKFEPLELAEFIEENMTYFQGPIVGAELLTMVQNLKVELKGELNVENSTQSGLRNLTIRDDHVLAGKSGDKTLSFPEVCELRLRVFDNCDAYDVKVFLRYRASKSGLVFWFKLPDPDGIEEEAFEQVVSLVAERSGLPTLHGRYEGPLHK